MPNDPLPGLYGQVTLTQGGPNVVNVLAQLYNGLEFVDNGAHNAFTFNVSGNPVIPASAVTSLTSGFGISDPVAPGSNPPFGSFMYAITLPNGGSNHHGSTLSFTLTLPGLTEASFVPNALNYYFAMDTWNQGVTRALGAPTEPFTTTEQLATAPEPASLALFGTGLSLLAARARRRNKSSSSRG
jgi:hypothetical protein